MCVCVCSTLSFSLGLHSSVLHLVGVLTASKMFLPRPKRPVKVLPPGSKWRLVTLEKVLALRETQCTDSGNGKFKMSPKSQAALRKVSQSDRSMSQTFLADISINKSTSLINSVPIRLTYVCAMLLLALMWVFLIQLKVYSIRILDAKHQYTIPRYGAMKYKPQISEANVYHIGISVTPIAFLLGIFLYLLARRPFVHNKIFFFTFTYFNCVFACVSCVIWCAVFWWAYSYSEISWQRHQIVVALYAIQFIFQGIYLVCCILAVIGLHGLHKPRRDSRRSAVVFQNKKTSVSVASPLLSGH